MFNLLISIVAIALVVVIGAAGMFYGGDAYTENTVEAEAAKMRNERSQIIAAIEVYKSSGNSLKSGFKFASLIEGGYLTQVPDGWVADLDHAYKPLDLSDPGTMNVCFTANQQDNFTFEDSQPDVWPLETQPGFGIPYCDKEGLDSIVPCCIGRE
ncbi:hypothetical protein LMH73_003675 [Vibrio splendidus]|nr:hypothetical protein [Vibrio splendidus]MCC4883244.1 hypothetical protein [Vibrio splendidus]